MNSFHVNEMEGGFLPKVIKEWENTACLGQIIYFGECKDYGKILKFMAWVSKYLLSIYYILSVRVSVLRIFWSGCSGGSYVCGLFKGCSFSCAFCGKLKSWFAAARSVSCVWAPWGELQSAPQGCPGHLPRGPPALCLGFFFFDMGLSGGWNEVMSNRVDISSWSGRAHVYGLRDTLFSHLEFKFEFYVFLF